MIQQALSEAAKTPGPPEKVQRYVTLLQERLGTDYELVDGFGDPGERIKAIQEKAYRYVFVQGEKARQDELQKAEDEYFIRHGKSAEDDRAVWEMKQKHEAEERRHKEWQQKYMRDFNEAERLRAKGQGGWSKPVLLPGQ